MDEVVRSKQKVNGQMVWVEESIRKPPPYPINELRNLAILGAEKRKRDGWIFVLDADAKPSNKMTEAIAQLTSALAYGDGPPTHGE